MSERKQAFRRIYEPDEKTVHAGPAPGTDQVTLCGITDWFKDTPGVDTKKPIDCWHCHQIIAFCQGHRKPPAYRSASSRSTGEA